MKKLLFASVAILFAAGAAKLQAQSTANEKKEEKAIRKEEKAERKAVKKLDGHDVSELAKDAFYANYGFTDGVDWKRSNQFDEATFTKDGKQMKAFYDNDAQLVGVVTTKTFADLPAQVQQKIKLKYVDYTINHVLYFEDNEANETDMVLYGTQFDDEDNYFVELNKGDKELILQVNSEDVISVFSEK